MADGELREQAWYRYYVLLVLLLLCVCSLATRNLLTYLVTVPVPECEETCAPVRRAEPYCGGLHRWPTGRNLSQHELCLLCMARVTPPAADAGGPAPAHESHRHAGAAAARHAKPSLSSR